MIGVELDRKIIVPCYSCKRLKLITWKGVTRCRWNPSQMDWSRIWYVHPNHNLANKVFCWFSHSSRQHRAMNISIFHKHRCLGLIGEGIHKSWNVEEPIFPWIRRWVRKLRAIKYMEAKSYKVYGARLYNDIFVLGLSQGHWLLKQDRLGAWYLLKLGPCVTFDT